MYVDSGGGDGSHNHVVLCNPFVSAWACGTDIVICAITEPWLSVGSLIRLLEWKSQLCQLLSV